MKLITTSLLLALAPLIPSRAVAADAQIALLGDSTVITSYLPTGERHHEVLEKALGEALQDRRVSVVNWADNGESIARYLTRGTYDKHRQSRVKPDIAIIRFGINDQKHSTTEQFRRHLERMIDLLQADFPGITVMLETGPYVDYPAHYEYDREAVLRHYWEVTRAVAEERGLKLIDFHAASRRETLTGNWDQRIRLTERAGEPRVFDDRYDAERGNQRWFSDIHPNPNGVRIAVDTEVPLLVERLKAPRPLQLPPRQTAGENPFPDPRNYAELLDFAPEWLERKPAQATSQDRFQQPTSPR